VTLQLSVRPNLVSGTTTVGERSRTKTDELTDGFGFGRFAPDGLIVPPIFMVEIPPDTKWYEVHNLTDQELTELHVVNFHTFNDPADQNELMKVVEA
jgi:hypothetical protein